jgi:hypothetical protein
MSKRLVERGLLSTLSFSMSHARVIKIRLTERYVEKRRQETYFFAGVFVMVANRIYTCTEQSSRKRQCLWHA